VSGSGRLIGAAELAARLGDPSLAVIEISFVDDDTSFRTAHVPGAAWAYWKRLLWHDTMRLFAPPERLARRLGELGAGSDRTLVLVGDPVQFGTYALWVLLAQGFHDVRVLDGGKENWLASGLPLEPGHPRPDPSDPREHAEADHTSIVGRDAVSHALAAHSHVLLDLRSPEEYTGKRVSPNDMLGGVDHGAERTGRIPGARHLYYRDLLHPNAQLRPSSEIISAANKRGVSFDDPIILYCRLSHRASLGWLALTEAGFNHIAVYDGSWTEWGSLVGAPIEQ
jgi:thiosulfate/3-mercaptopyruvate sulfurtransferase